MLGLTGSGKSTLCNELLFGRKNLFKNSDKTVSCTDDIQVEEGKWCDGIGDLKIVDVPGFGDSQGRD